MVRAIRSLSTFSEDTVSRTVARRKALALAGAGLAGAFTVAGATEASAGPRAGSARPHRGIPRGYASVDPRTARRVPLWQELGPDNPIFEGDPPYTDKVWTTIDESGYLLEQITSLGTHTGTHISAPAHFVEGGRYLSELDEGWTLMPLVVVDVRRRPSDFVIETDDLKAWERKHGRIPPRGCVLLLSGFGEKFTSEAYFDTAPGFSQEATTWLFDHRGIRALGSDTFGPDATSDEDFLATLTTLQKGGITVENVGPGLEHMRPHGDWININGGRPHYSGFQMGITGFTR
jgi:kynurenine formamidase